MASSGRCRRDYEAEEEEGGGEDGDWSAYAGNCDDKNVYININNDTVAS